MAVITTQLSSGWKVKQTDDDSSNAWLPVSKVPTSIHQDLLDNGKIPDPFVDMNELSVRWIAEKSWTYRTTFPSPTNVHSRARTDLVFKGLDTFATVTLNGKRILQTDNMFLEYRVDITGLLNSTSNGSSNELKIVFDSALLRGRELVRQHEHEHRHIAHQTEQSRLPVRKAQYHWGWDWAGILITTGPWRPVFLESYVGRVDDVWFQGQVSSDLKSVSGKLFARASLAGQKPRPGLRVKFTLSLDGRVVYESQGDSDGDGVAMAAFRTEEPTLWYPHGYGKQTRYRLKAVLVGTDSESEMSSKSKFVGFRRCELIQERDDFGKSFYFRINNVDVFAGGSCWIPADNFLSHIGPDRYRKWMELMIQGNQIMTRIWGGGIYEDDAFFDACDELGILVWQDFCFACGSYPTYPSFLHQIEQEARYNVRRLRSHPSLVIWAGNNEDYQIQEKYSLDYDYEGDKDPESWLRSSFPARYVYEYLLPKVVEQEDPGSVYHPSSPWGDGKKTFDPTVGDIHQWNVWHGMMKRHQELPTMGGRFVSEFGMEAYPHLSTISSAITDPAQQYPGSMVMDYHNRAIDHERRLITYVAENFQIKYDLPSFTHLTQLTQSDAMGFAYRSWRRDWGTPGARKCGGVLVWQLNDCWPTMSWAVADYYLVKKPSFYAIARALTPLAVGVARPFHDWTSGHADPTRATRDHTFDVWIASSRTETVQADVEVRFISIKTGKDIAAAVEKNIDVQLNCTTDVLKQASADVSSSSSPHDPRQPFNTATHDPYVIHARLTVSGTCISTDTAWPHPLKYLAFDDRGIKVQLSSAKDKLIVTANKPVHGFVFRENRDWVVFSDNGFDVMPGEEVVVDIKCPEGFEMSELRWTYLGAESGLMGFAGEGEQKLAPKL
ncbi:uncharacterized protein Z518_06576 [Rhinocladiella mackenziei CBS 650.93]|uniref:Beta-mannosidase B n=1 Tax=Rhinocladiella mackenziei CBS 650.93 TaxID=1442369 RepID=A0A0D2IID1_9EURO|nr:uncharacterized protein Z518_06576 [Rhinocladiella mackenziei CBS 650.93]KIX03026.1 hypothetical protein Z518_06576 [Rhinocladiella mackenziei CBS 650.93]